MRKNFTILAVLLLAVCMCLFAGTATAEEQAVPEGMVYEIVDGTARILYYDGYEEHIIIPSVIEGCPVTVIGEYAFYENDDLLSVVIPDSVTTIEQEAFYYCEYLQEVTFGSGLTTIGDRAFMACDGLSCITLSADVTSLGENVFSYCEDLEGIWVDAANPNYCSDENGILYDKNKTVLLQAPAALFGSFTVPDGVTRICADAFYDCWYLTDVTLPDSLAEIGSYAFGNCESLTAVYGGRNVTVIGADAFKGCSDLTDITLPQGLTEIADGLFDGCYDLADITIPQGVTRIGEYAFNACSLLKQITIPENVSEIGEAAFIGCTSLQSIIVPEAVTIISEDTFYGCSSLTTVKLGKNVTAIESCAFYSCSNLYELTIPATVTYLGGYCFEFCTRLSGIEFLGSAPTFVGYNAFYKVSATVWYTDDGTWTEEIMNSMGGSLLWKAVEVVSGGTCGTDLRWALNNRGILTISGTGAMEDFTAQTAPWYAEKASISIVVIEDGVTSVGNYAFTYISKLTSISIPDSVTRIGECAFEYTGLRTVEIPQYVQRIEQMAFNSCQSLGSVTGGESVTQIDDWAFASSNVSEISFLDNLTVVGKGALYGTWLVYYYDEGIVYVGSSIYTCKGTCPEAVTVPANVTCISGEAFKTRTTLREITFEGSAPIIGEDAFLAVTATAYYPAGDATWTEEVMQNYGGTLTWVSYGEPAVEKFDIDVSRMVLGNSLEFQFGISKDKLTDTTGLYAVVEKGEIVKTIPAAQWGSAGQYWAVTYDDLAAKEMGDTISVTVYNAQGEAISNAKTDSARDYVARAFDGQTDKGKTMMVDMLNYGAAAQQKFGYKTDDLANSGLTAAQKAYGTNTAAPTKNVQAAGPNFKGARLSLEGRIQLQVAFAGMDRSMYAVYSYTDHNGKAQSVTVEGKDFIEAGGVYGIELSKLVYADARTLVTVRVYKADGTLYSGTKDSIESYVHRSTKDAELFDALMKFADSAKVYLHQ